MKRLISLLIICGMILIGSIFAWASEKPLPTFRITGYIEEIYSDSIKVFVPRMKKSLSLFLAQNLKITDFVSQKEYSLKDLKERDMAVCVGVISAKGFICQSIAFVRNNPP